MAVRPTHFEIYSADPRATVEFLTTVFGWWVEQWEDQDYWLVDTGDGPGISGVALAGDDGPRRLTPATSRTWMLRSKRSRSEAVSS